MRHHESTDDTQETAALYALGALSQFEARAFESHLRDGCSVCETGLAGFEKVVGALSLTATPVEPPARVRDLLESRIGSEARPSRTVQSQPGPGRAPSFVAWALAASLAAICILSIVAWQRADRALGDREAEIAQLSEEAASIRDQLRRQIAQSREFEQILSALKSPGSRIIPVLGEQKTAVPVAEVYWDTSASRWVITANLQPVPADRVYQLWFVTKTGKAISAGLLQTDQVGHGFTVVDVPRGMSDLKAVAISLEPAGGSPQPTTQPLAIGTVG